MKNIFFVLFLIFFAFLACRNDENSVQNIDQVLNIYIDSAGIDLLNNTLAGSYSNIRLNDVNGLRDEAPVNFSNIKDADTMNYVEYVAGARRIAIDSSQNSKTYESKIAFLLTKKINDSTDIIVTDTMAIQYNFTSDLFQISKVFYNDVLKFTKVQGQPNIVRITK